jgi:hypothetical protein
MKEGTTIDRKRKGERGDRYFAIYLWVEALDSLSLESRVP